MNIITRFFDKTLRDESTGCLIWTGATDTNGYGCFRLDIFQTIPAHIFAYVLHHKKEPLFQVHHFCLNIKCVEGSHLQDLTPAEHQKFHHRTCKNGHDLTIEENIYLGKHKRGFVKECKLCRDEYQKSYRERKRNASRQTVAVSTVTK